MNEREKEEARKWVYLSRQKAELLMRTFGRSVFATVSSPSTEETVNGRFWCIEQQSELFPAPISGREQYVTS